MENPYYSPNPAPVQEPTPTPTPTPTKNSNFRLIAGVLAVLILLLVGFILFTLSRQSMTPSDTQTPTSETNQDVVNDPLEVDEDTEDSNNEIYVSENFNLTFHYPVAYGVASMEYDDGEKNPRCTYEKVTFSSSTSEVYIYNDRELGAQTCVPSFAGTSVEGYTNTNAYGNSYSIAILEVNSKFQAVGTAMISGADETEFTTLFVTEGATEEEARDEIDALINRAEFDPEFK